MDSHSLKTWLFGRNAMVDRRRFLQYAAVVATATGLPMHQLLGNQSDLAANGALGARFRPRSQHRRPTPSASQIAWQQDELALFIHFGINTFTNREWGDGSESPQLFNPTQLDTTQWARAANTAGAKAMILTAKHHDGFCLWPTATTKHSVASSPWAAGNGDVVGDFVAACRSHGLRPGLYCSPWDRNHPTYGDSPRYNDVYIAQLTELLTRYGPIQEVWFDGANGEGPNGKRQTYDWPRIWETVRRLQPDAVIFSDAGPDVRWIGNERGVAGETHWSTIRPESVPFIGASGDGVIQALQEGHPDGSVWRPGETDVSIRPGWFYHPAEDQRVKTVEQLTELYFTSVGRNSKLLLNVPPATDGLLSEIDVARLSGMRQSLNTLFSQPLSPTTTSWRVVGATRAEVHLEFATPQTLSVVDMREDIQHGQQVASWVLSTGGNAPREITRGTTIGFRQLRRVTPQTVSSLTLRVDTLDAPRIVQLIGYA